MTVVKIRGIVYVIDCLIVETPHGKYLWKNVLSLIRFVPLDQNPKIKIYHMVASEYPEVIEGRRQLISTDVLDSEEESEDGSIDILIMMVLLWMKSKIVVQERRV